MSDFKRGIGGTSASRQPNNAGIKTGRPPQSVRAGFTGVPGTAIIKVGKKTACFSGIEYHLIAEKIL